MERILRILRESFVLSMSTFLKLSVPILATLISSIINSPSFDCVTAGIEQFKTMSIKLLGDTGAAHDIGSLETLPG